MNAARAPLAAPNFLALGARHGGIVLFAGTILLGPGAGRAQAEDGDTAALRTEVNVLKAQLAVMQQHLSDLEARLPATEPAASGVFSHSVAGSPTTAPTAAPALISEIADAPAPSLAQAEDLRPSAVPVRQTFGDAERGVARVATAAPLDDPELKEFWQIPGTQTLVKFGGFAKVSMIYDTAPSGSPDGFVTSQIPTSKARYGAFDIDPYATRFNLDIRSPGLVGPLRIYFENDFYTGSGSAGFHLRQAYGQAGSTYAGFGYSAFTDPDALAETLDDQGPGSEALIRLPTVREIVSLSRNVTVSLSAEKSSSDLTVGSGQVAVQQAPDLVASWRLEQGWGHIHLAGLYRQLGYTDGTFAHQAEGYGGVLSGVVKLGGDYLVGGVTGGQGIGRYINDLSGKGYDAAIAPGGALEPLRLLGGYLGLTHAWSSAWRSNLVGGYLVLEHSSLLSPTAFRASQYTAADLIWAGSRSFYVGVEGLYGRRESQDDEIRNDLRLQISLRYNLVR